MKIKILTIIIALSFISCASYTKNTKYPSPDGEYIIDVVTEDQGANDPDPIWQHISIREKEISKPVLPGNILIVSAYNQPSVKWLNNKSVNIEFSGMFGESFRVGELKTKKWNGITIEFSIKGDIERNEP
jgi:hypothetical protein